MFYTNRAVSVKKTKINPGRLQTPILSWHEQHVPPASHAGPLQGIPAWAVPSPLLWEVVAHPVFLDGMGWDGMESCRIYVTKRPYFKARVTATHFKQVSKSL